IKSCPWCADEVLASEPSPDASSSLSILANVADDILASKAGDVSASSLIGEHGCLAEGDLPSLMEGLVEDAVSLSLSDASAQRSTVPSSVPVNDAFTHSSTVPHQMNVAAETEENKSLKEHSEKNESLTKDVADETEKNESLTSLVDGVVSLYMNDASTHPSSPVNAAQSSSASPPQSPPPPPEIGIRRSSRTWKEPVKYSPSFSKNKKK
ncbi:hypothetical protein L195_g050806, partial [Trifolium pratense]